MIREVIHLNIGTAKIPTPTPADMALANLLSMVPIKLWAMVPEALDTCFEHNPPTLQHCGRFANIAALKFNSECLAALGQMGKALKKAKEFDLSKASAGLADDTQSIQQYQAKAVVAEQALRPLVDGEAYQHFVDLCIAHDCYATYVSRVAYQVGYQEGLEAAKAGQA